LKYKNKYLNLINNTEKYTNGFTKNTNVRENNDLQHQILSTEKTQNQFGGNDEYEIASYGYDDSHSDETNKLDTINTEYNAFEKNNLTINNNKNTDEHTTGIEEQTTGIEEQTTGIEEQTTGIEEQTTGIEEQTTGIEEQTTGIEEQTTGIEPVTIGIEEQTTGLTRETVSKEPVDLEQLYNKVKNITWSGISDNDNKVFQESSNASTYGTIEKQGIDSIVKYYKEKSNHKEGDKIKFIDLGCGEGIGLISATLFHGDLFEEIVGIELSEKRVESANNRISRLPSQYQTNVSVIKNDLLNHAIDNHDIIFISNLCFSNEIQDSIVNKLVREAKKDSIIFVSKKFQNITGLQFIETVEAPMSWNRSHKLNVYKIV